MKNPSNTNDRSLRRELACRLYADGMSLREVGDVFGVTGECIRLWLSRAGVPTRRSGRPATRKRCCRFNHYDRALASKLLDTGLTTEQVLNLFGTKSKRALGITGSRDNLVGHGDTPCRTPQCSAIWHEVNRLVVYLALSDGASIKDIATLLGTSYRYAATYTHRMRRHHGWKLPGRKRDALQGDYQPGDTA